MKTSEYNWATAEMMIMYLRNSHAQEKRKACKAAEVSGITQDAPTANTGPTAASSSTEEGPSDDLDSEKDLDDDK